MHKLRVLLVTGSLPPMKCGVGDYCQNLTEALASRPEIHVGVLTNVSGGDMARTDGVEIFPVMRNWGIVECINAIKIIRHWSPDIVHIQYPTQGYGKRVLPWLLPIISFLMGKKVVQTWHELYGIRHVLQVLLISILPCALIFVRPRYEQSLHPCLRWALWNKDRVFIPNASAIPRAQLDDKSVALTKNKYLKGQKRLIVFFGFVYPIKGVEYLFDIADPDLDHIIIVGEGLDKGYQQEIVNRASDEEWLRKTTIAEFLPAADVSVLLAISDAVILPFRTGGGDWNTSIHGAVLNRAFVITTSLAESGYDKRRNIYFSKVDDIEEMKLALEMYAGARRGYDADIDGDQWGVIAGRHCLVYGGLSSSG